MNEIETKLIEFLSETTYEDLPPEAVEGAKRCVLDTLGVMAAGAHAGGIGTLRAYLAGQPNRPEATVLVHNEKLSVFHAIWVNAAMSRATEFDDSHDASGEHISVPILASGLGAAELLGGVSGKDFIAAYAMACELVPRLRECPVRDGMPFFGFAANSYAPFSAAVMSARLLGLKGEDMYNALAWAYAQMAGAVQLQQGGGPALHIHHGLAAATGFRAAQLAGLGLPGTPDFIFGRFGVLNAYERGSYDPAPLTRDLGVKYVVSEISVKQYPSGRVTHTPADAALEIHKKLAGNLDKVKEISVKYTKGGFAMTCLPEADRHFPTNPQHAKFSLYYVVACALLRGHVELADFSEEAVNDPRIREVIARTRVDVDEKLPMLLPGMIDVRLEDGSILSAHLDHFKGGLEEPNTFGEIGQKTGKCFAFAGQALSDGELNKLMSGIANMEGLENVVPLFFKP